MDGAVQRRLPDLLSRFAIYGSSPWASTSCSASRAICPSASRLLGVGSYFTGLDVQAPDHERPAGVALAMLLVGHRSALAIGCHAAPLRHVLLDPDAGLRADVLQPRLFGADAATNGETGCRSSRRSAHSSSAFGCSRASSLPTPELFGIEIGGYVGFYLAVILIVCFYIAIRIFRSPFGMMLRAIKSNQTRLGLRGFNTRPYALAAFVVSGMYAGLAGSLLGSSIRWPAPSACNGRPRAKSC